MRQIPPRLSLLIVPRPPGRPDADRGSLNEAVELAQAADDAGFHACYFPEHHGRDDGYPSSPLTVAAYVAGRTPRIGVGTGVALLPLHNPLAFAEQLATLDVLLGDRLHRVGVGMGGLPGDYAAMGVPKREMVRRFTDSLEVLRRLWAGETVTAGVGSSVLTGARLSPRPRPGRPLPVAIGAMAEPSVRRAGVLGLPWITDPSHSLDTLERLAEIYWSAAGDGGEVVLMRNAWPAGDAETLWWPHVERSLVEFSVGAGRLREEPGVLIGWEGFRDRVLTGPPGDLPELAAAAAGRVNASEVVIRFGFPTGPGHRAVTAAVRSLDLTP